MWIIKDRNSTLKDHFILLGKCCLIVAAIDTIAALSIALSDTFIFNGSFPLLGNKARFTDFYSLKTSILLMVLESPVTEEFAFRGWFSKNRILVSISIAAFIYFLLDVILFKVLNTNKNFVYLCFSILIPLSFLLTYQFSKSIIDRISVNNNFFIILSITLFSFLHVFNFNITKISYDTIAGLIIILWTYPITAYIFTYVRIKNGLAWSIALHSLTNLFVILPALLSGKPI